VNDKDGYQALIASLTTFGLLGLVVGIMRGIIQQKHGSIGAFFRGIVASIFVAVIVSWGLADGALSPTTRATIIGVCSFIADDILLGLMSLGSLMGRDPLGFFSRLLAAYRGQSVQLPPPPTAAPETPKND
jgi:hypothetical protein